MGGGVFSFACPVTMEQGVRLNENTAFFFGGGYIAWVGGGGTSLSNDVEVSRCESPVTHPPAGSHPPLVFSPGPPQAPQGVPPLPGSARGGRDESERCERTAVTTVR
eukprot:597244-Rhodomonas_salina.1